VQPTASADDLRPAVREFPALVQAGIPRAKLFSRLTVSALKQRTVEARAYINEAGYDVLEGCLLERPAYRKAVNVTGRSQRPAMQGSTPRQTHLFRPLIDKVQQNG
jgi:chromosome partitioning protein